MRNQNEIRRDFPCVDFFRQRIWSDERIEKQRLAACSHRETSMTVISKVHGERSATDCADLHRFFRRDMLPHVLDVRNPVPPRWNSPILEATFPREAGT